jgi:hypothetical protein
MAPKPVNTQMELGLECYDPEHTVSLTLPGKIKSGIGLSKRDVLLILKWKITRITDNYKNTVTDAAMAK